MVKGPKHRRLPRGIFWTPALAGELISSSGVLPCATRPTTVEDRITSVQSV